MKISHLISALFISTWSLSASAETYILDNATRFDSVRGYGYDRIPTPAKNSPAPYYFSVRVPDGNYKVTFDIGNDRRDANTTIRTESRRLLVENLPTKKGESIKKTFVINKRSPAISDNESVKIKEREKSKLDWDGVLTFEINGKAPACRSICIEPADSNITTVYLCGNSTVVDQEREPWASWGQMIPRFFNDQVSIANYGESGESAASFIASKRLKRALRDAKSGDWFFVEFGHNDQKIKGSGKGAFYSFMTNLKYFIDEVRDKGANIVFVTPTRRRFFDKYGASINTHEDYPEAMRWISEKENVPLIELNGMTAKLYEAFGPEESKKAFVHYPMGSLPGQNRVLEDNTHFNPFGAYQIAKCIIEGMRTAAPGLFIHITDFESYDPSKPDSPADFYWAPAPFCEIEKPDGN